MVVSYQPSAISFAADRSHIHPTIAIDAEPTAIGVAHISNGRCRILNGAVMVESQPNVLRAIDFDGRIKPKGDDIADRTGDFELLGRNQSTRSSIAAYIEVNGVGGGKLLFTCIQETKLSERTALVLVHQIGWEHITPIEGHPDADNLWR